MKKLLYILFLSCLFISCQSSDKNPDMDIFQQLIHENKKRLGAPIENPEKFELQIIYTQIDRDENNHPYFTSYSFREDANQYFYPASTVKMPTAFLALEKINNLKIEGLTKHTPLNIGFARNPQTMVAQDSTAENGLPSIAHYVKKIFLVSDNDAHNRLYEFLGQDELNNSLKNKGFTNTKIVHRLGPEGAPFGVEENKYTNPLYFYEDNDDEVDISFLYKQSEKEAKNIYANKLNALLKGKGYIANDSLINESKDFSTKNYCALKDMEAILQAVIFPEATPEKSRFNLTENDYQFLYKAMSMRPRESKFPKYTAEEYDSYVKFFIYGNTKTPMPDYLRIYNKVGWAYGYLSDASYVVDLENKVEFFLTAVISVNENQIYNDDKYEYDNIGVPFMENLGKVVYEYELKRKRKVIPDLSKFEIDYKE